MLEVLALLKTIIIALPELIRLIRNIQDYQAQNALDAKVKKDLGAINDAFERKDAAALDAIFSN